MINFAQITRAVEAILKDKTSGYTIVRNGKKSIDVNEASRGKGWVGIYRDKQSNEGHAIASRPWLTEVSIFINITVTGKDGGNAEDNLQAAEDEITTLFFAPASGNLKLGGTVDIITGFDVDYDYDDNNDIWWHRAIINLKAEVRQ